MSPYVREQADDSRIELGTTVSWPHIIAGASLLIVPVAIGLIMLIGSGSTPTDPPRTERTFTPAREVAQVVPHDSALDAFDERSTRFEILPVPREAEVLAHKPALPVGPEMLPKPKVIVAKPPVAVAGVTPPAPVGPPQIVVPAQTSTYKRRFCYYEDELQSHLLHEVPEIDIEKEKGTTKRLLTEKKSPAKKEDGTNKLVVGAKTTSPSPVDHKPFLEHIARRDDLKGLPFRDVEKCQAPADESKSMQKLSTEGRRGALVTRSSTKKLAEGSQSEVFALELQMADYVDKKLTGSEWSEEAGLRLLVQMFQIERPAVRMQIIKKLAASKAKNAGAALAQRAIFDLSHDVREAAIVALKQRPTADYRQQLLQALRYPWPPMADHAAEAIVALGDRDAVPDLIALLDEPDPRDPFQNKEKKWVTAELVRVNHLGNCVLCHAPATTRNDPVRGVVPTRGQELPAIYYDNRTGDFIRADVTYLQQDFSLMQPVAEPNKWPAVQRFDYLVCQRELTAEEIKVVESSRANDANKPKTYPQRESVLWALHELTGYEPGGK